MPHPLDDADQALLRLLQLLRAADYRFITASPATHRRVLRREPGRTARSLRDIFGWSLPFERETAGEEVVSLLEAAGLLEETLGGLKSGVRVSSLGGLLLLHSAFPTEAEDSVFFGPDTYRFAAFLAQELGEAVGGGVIADIGTGSGAGGLVASGFRPGARVILGDINPKALRLARVNAAHAGVEAEVRLSPGLQAVSEPLSVVVANPPFIAGGERTYRDGGDMHGARLSLDWAKEAMAKLAPGGRFLLYTGSAIVEGEDPFRAALAEAAEAAGLELRYRELDPDIFGGELAKPAYEAVERIAAVGAVVSRA